MTFQKLIYNQQKTFFLWKKNSIGTIYDIMNSMEKLFPPFIICQIFALK